MRLTKHRRKTMAAMDMTPMIDITFQLLIFFMTCSQISEVNTDRDVEPPQLKGSVDQDENTTITVNINQEGDMTVSGHSFSMSQLVAAVGDALEAAKNEPTRIHVVLRADRRGNSRTVNRVVTALDGIGIRQVRTAVQDPE